MRRAACCLLLAAGCAPGMETPGTPTRALEGELLSRAGVAVGRVRVQITATGSAAAVEVEGARPGAVHPWHVHRGNCATGGEIMGSLEAYPVLRVGSSGNAQRRTELPLPLSPEEVYHVNLHASPTEMETIVACADLTG